jgi:hypothetical protein
MDDGYTAGTAGFPPKSPRHRSSFVKEVAPGLWSGAELQSEVSAPPEGYPPVRIPVLAGAKGIRIFLVHAQAERVRLRS